MPGLKKHIYILTGFSGSGKTTALRYIEELGFYCIDNLPAELLHEFTALIGKNKLIDKIAVVIDARGKDFMSRLEPDLTSLKKKHHLKIIFFDADLAHITKRFKESRLRHPLSLKGSIKDGFVTEKTLLSSLQEFADITISTSNLNPHKLKSIMQKIVLKDQKKVYEINFMSFGFKHGKPEEADIVIDVRFLKNPHFVAKLKNKTGTNTDVQKYVFSDSRCEPFVKKTKSYLDFLIKQYIQEGKSYTTVAFGCTGGRHRSVAIAETLGHLFKAATAHDIRIIHRDIKST